jgi:hypothetical protein
MDINEARSVLWIRPNRRPLGELMDEGLLSKGQLEWAVTHAYNPKLQEAAKIVLQQISKGDSKGVGAKKTAQPDLQKLDMPITVDQARSTVWPLPPYKGEPMGPLVDEKKLSLKDLGYAVENAWKQNVRNAALVLSAIRMRQIVKEPQPSKGYINVFTKGRSFSTRKVLQITQTRGLVFGFVLGAALVILFSIVFGRNRPESSLTIGEVLSSPSGVAALIIIFALLVGVTMFLLFIVDRTVKELDDLSGLFQKGAEGEERVADIIKRSLNGDWSLFRNLIIPGQKGGDMDAVLVGPNGVWNLEIKALSGKFKNTGELWQCLERKKWKTVKRNPSTQSRNNSLRLKNLLKADHLSVFIHPVVVWANPESPLKVENPSVPVWTLGRLEEELGNIQEEGSIPDADRKKINEKLKKLIGSDKKIFRG